MSQRITLKKFLLALVLIYLMAGVGLFCFQRHIIFTGRYAVVSENPPKVEGGQWFRVETSHGEVDAVFCPPTTSSTSFPVLIFGHGNGEVIDGWVHRLEVFRNMGLGVLLVEYPGYGRSQGSPSEAGIQEAMANAYDQVIELPGVDSKRMIGYGQSLGGGAICALARVRPLSVLILQSTFTSLRPMTARYLMPSFLLRDVFDNAEVLASYPQPVLLFHGLRDIVVSFKHGLALSKIAPDCEMRIYDCAHNCWQPERFPIVNDIKNFLHNHHILP